MKWQVSLFIVRVDHAEHKSYVYVYTVVCAMNDYTYHMYIILSELHAIHGGNLSHLWRL